MLPEQCKRHAFSPPSVDGRFGEKRPKFRRWPRLLIPAFCELSGSRSPKEWYGALPRGWEQRPWLAETEPTQSVDSFRVAIPTSATMDVKLRSSINRLRPCCAICGKAGLSTTRLCCVLQNSVARPSLSLPQASSAPARITTKRDFRSGWPALA